MRKTTKRATAMAMAAVMTAAALAGCSGGSSDTSTTAATAAPTTAAAGGETTAAGTEAPATDKPYEGVKLTWWTKLNANISATYPNWGDTPWAKYVQEKTGIELEFIHPTVGSEKEEFAILVASGEYPDIIQWSWTTYAGGAGAAISDGILMDLDETMANHAPNFSALMESHPDIARAVKSSDGHYYGFPLLRGIENPNITQFSSGMVLRKDVLDELGMELPETIDEWDAVLRAYKEYGFEVPFVTRKDWMKDVWSPGFDNWGNFYVEDGTVKHGFIEDSRKELILKLRDWYEEGLINRDWLVDDKSSNQTYFTTGKSAVAYAPFGQGLGQYTQIMHDADPEITEEAIRSTVPVTSKKGQNAKFSKMNQIYDDSCSAAGISTQCKNVEAAAWLLDWMYSEEGNLCSNFGIEGVSYEMVDGQPVYTDVIMNNPDGLTIANALASYISTSTSGVGIQDPRYIEQYYEQDNQKEALELSMKTDMGDHFFPPTSVAPEDQSRFADIMNNVKTLAEEMEAQFIAGAVSMDDWDSYIAQLKAFGIEEAIGMMQKAYDQYMAN